MYKSSNFRRPQPTADAPPLKFSQQAKQLQELFPNWTPEDLHTLLGEVNGDIDLAATRITEGHAEQWGSVTRKKDKKSITPSNSQSKEPASRERGDFRGVRGGRGGRGGPGRGGAARGAFARGAHHETNGRHPKPTPSQSTDLVEAAASADAPASDATATDAAPTPADGSAPSWVSPTVEPTSDGSPWVNPATSTPVLESSTPSAWTKPEPKVNGTTLHSPVPAQASIAAKLVTKTPATSKLSWAQVAKPQEKPAPQPPAVVPQISAPEHARPEPVPPREPTPPPAPSSEPVQSGWEEPTTVQAPSWDDEPATKPPPSAWTTTQEPLVAEEIKPKEQEARVPPPQPESAPVLSALPAQLQVKPEPVAPAPQKPATPAGHTRPTSSAAHRHSAKFKTDQAVVMPSSSFGSVEKIGMQFGSLSLSGDDAEETPSAPAPEPAAPASAPVVEQPAPEPAPVQPVQPVQVQAQAPEPVIPAAVAQPTSNGTSALFQQVLPQQTQQQYAIPTSLPAVSQTQQQPALSVLSQQTQATPTTASISPYSHQSQVTQMSSTQQQPSLASHHAPPHQQTQPQAQLHSQQNHYVQHGLPTHVESVPAGQPQSAQSQQQHSSFFRQQEAPYFHAPTPPVSATQSQESPYGSFGQLGQLSVSQLAHQTQASHLSGFGQGEYGYNDNQRTFYDSYSGAPGFNNRNVLGHEDIKGLPGAPQQTHGAPGLPPSNSQPSQQLPQSAQSNNQSQPGSQGPQQYPPPLPYYYPFPQNQYYGTPYNSGYTVPQPFVKYPTVFQGPPGPQSAPSPAGKQGPSSVQPQSPYGQGLYGQQHSSNAYDEIGYQHHSQHSHGQSVSSIPTNEYKQLYGSSGQGMQGFISLGQNGGPSANPQLGQRGTGGSPETSYKPYGGNVVKDVGAGVGVGVGQAGAGQGPQGRGAVQPQQQASFYSAQRFASSAAGAPPSTQSQHQQPQGQGPQGHLGYPQGGSEGNGFYSYQPRQQQGYWQ